MTISIVMPAYNARATIFDALDSALSQTLRADEIIVIDDGSTDGTGDAVARKYGSSVTLIQQTNAGVSAARNRGIEAASGEFIQFLDADDMLDARKLERSLDLAHRTGAPVVYGPARFVAADGRTPVDLIFPPLPSGSILAEWLTGTMAGGTYGVCSSFFVARRVLLEAEGFATDMSQAEDWHLWIRLAARHRFAALDEPLVIYRVLPTGASRHDVKMAHGRLTVIRRVRELPDVQAILAKPVLDRLEAGRWHVYAMRLWESGQRREAREAFAAANRLAPSPVRALYSRMSYILPANSVALINRVLQLRGKNKPSGSGPSGDKTLS